MTAYQVTIEIDKDIPVDVLTEHIGAALKQFRTEAVPATAPRITVRKLASGGYINGGITNGSGTISATLSEPVAPPRIGARTAGPAIGDKIGYKVEGPVERIALSPEDAKLLKDIVGATNLLPELYDQFNGRQGRNHPFEGPEVFDDEPVPTDDEVTVGTITDSPQNLEGEMYPHIGELIRDLNRRESLDWQIGEGDWDLPAEDKVGEDD